MDDLLANYMEVEEAGVTGMFGCRLDRDPTPNGLVRLMQGALVKSAAQEVERRESGGELGVQAKS